MRTRAHIALRHLALGTGLVAIVVWLYRIGSDLTDAPTSLDALAVWIDRHDAVTLAFALVRLEALQLSLRTRDGVPSNALPDDPELRPLVAVDGGRATLTVEGRLLANEVALRLRHPISAAGSSKT